MSRTEQQVAAEVIVRILDSGVIPTARNPRTMLRIAEATRVPLDAIRDAWRHLDTSAYRAPAATATRPAEEPPAPPAAVEAEAPGLEVFTGKGGRYGSTHVENVTAAVRRSARYKAANPAPGKRRCAECEQVKPVDQFPVKDRKTGRRRSYCSPCWKVRQRARYVNVGRERFLNTVGITLTLAGEDDILGLACADCRRPLEPGDEVHASGVAFSHTDCEAAVGRSEVAS